MLPRAGKGKSRGVLMKQIVGSAEEDKDASDSGTVEDSGVGYSPTLTGTSQRPISRGKAFEAISSSSDSFSHNLPSTSSGKGIGRAKLLQSVQSQSAHSSSSPGETTKSSSGKGRGKLFERLLSESPQSPYVQSVQSSSSQEQEVERVTQEVKELHVSEEVQSVEEPVEKIEPVIKRGEFGEKTNAATNYLRLKSDPNKGVFEYEVRFSPSVDSRDQRMRYLNQHREQIGTKTFDGVTLYLPILLKDRLTILHSNNPVDNSEIEIKITYKRKKPLKECIHLYNVLFDRVMKALNYVRSDRKQYDPTSPKIIPHYKLEIWPGYVTAVDEYEDGIMLCCDVSHRVLCQSTVLEKMNEIYRANPSRFQEEVKKCLLGSVILTRYNNKTYRVDDIDFQSNPLSTFQMGNGREISYVNYYETQYNIRIADKRQPLLINRKQKRVAGQEVPEEFMFCLIPEICYLTGLRDEMRSNYKLMKEIATYTKVTPNQRVSALQKFCDNVNKCKEARDILSSWGLEINEKPEKLQCRQYPEEEILFAKAKFPAGVNASFARHATNNELLEVVNVHNWLLISTRNCSNAVKSFLDHVKKVSTPMGIQISKPIVQILNDDRNDSYVNALRQYVKSNTQIVVIICPTSRDDRYAVIKKILCAEIPVPSQVINAKTLSNDSKNRSIVQKIVLQMNCKLGGTLWSIRIPSQSLMICGIDSYHDAGQKGNSVAAFVASLNSSYTKWYSGSVIQSKKEEIVNGLCASFKFALQAYEKMNNCLPGRIMIFRDGVGDGQLKLCSEYEIPQFQEACRIHHPDYEPKITFIVVQKRINTRIFAEAGKDFKNPDPGFVLDHTVTRRYLYDYFLVSQSVREGTVSPTHYIVVKDNADFKPDIIQRISYKLCFLYYNWPGTVRVPACCQYAHKLAYLVGQNIKRPTSELLADKLFYL